MNEFLQAFQEGITAQLVSAVIDAHQNDRERMKGLYDRYKIAAVGVPILQRTPIDYEDFETGAVKRIDNQVNNLLNNSFDGDIVDTKVGYMFGHAISYQVDSKEKSEKVEDIVKTPLETLIEEFNLRSNVEDEDAEWGKKAAICGYGARIAYVDTDGKERIKNINPWEVIILSSNSIAEPEFAIRYYKVNRVMKDGTKKEYFKAEVYDSTKIYFYESENDGDYSFIKEQPHMFSYCPLYGLPNNEELMGDAERVVKLIDAYDRTLSDASNEIEQYRLAYLILKGMGADEETLKNLKKTGIFELYEETDDIKYLTKDINDQMIENHLNRLEENILRFAKSVNFSDESFGGNVTGVAMKFKIMALENKCITMERKMTAALRYQFKVLCSAWSKRNICSEEDYLKVWFGFKRNLPVNLLDEAQTTQSLQGRVSEKTRLSLLSFVDDVDYELEALQKEAEDFDSRQDSLGGEDEDEPIGD
ncbi:phage portal protein [Cytobacillus horneckiae]|uniref:phage portal protein n=1 Tax=Cytobacillus horneckiae TaxID=549687 RepID=UPI003D9A1317